MKLLKLARKNNGGSGDNYGIGEKKDLLSPDKNTNLITSQVSLQSQVSNPFHIQIIEDNDSNEFISKKSRNSSLQPPKDNKNDNLGDGATKEEKNEVEEKQEDAGKEQQTKIPQGMDNTADTNEANQDAAENQGTEDNVPKKKKKKKKKTKKSAQPETQNEDDPAAQIAPAENPEVDTTNAKDEEIEKKEEEQKQPEPKPKDKDPISLDGIANIETAPLNLDKLLLSDQTNSILKSKKKKKKKKKVKANNESEETKEPLDGDIHEKFATIPAETPEAAKARDSSKRLGELRIKTKPNSGNTGSTVLAGSFDSNNNNKFGIRTSDSSGKVGESAKIKVGEITPLSLLSGKKELGKLKNPRDGTPKRVQNTSRLHNTSVMDGGDVDVKTYIKNINKIEQEKNKAKRELMSGSLSSKSSAKMAKVPGNRYL